MIGRTVVCAALAATLAAQPAGLPSGFTNVLYAQDLLPQLEALLGSPQVEQLLQRSPLLRGALADAGIPVGALRTASRLLAPFVPRVVVAAAPDATMTALGALIRLAGHIAVLETAELDDLQRDALSRVVASQFDKLQQLPLHVEVQARSEAVAERWFEQLAEQLEDMRPGRGLTVKLGDDRIELSFAPADVHGWDTATGKFEWAGKAAAVRWSLVLTRAGDRFRLTSGVQEGLLAATAMHPLWREGGEPMVFAQADFRPILTAVTEVEDLLDEHGDGLDQVFEARPEVGLAVRQMVVMLGALDDTVALSLRRLDDGIDWREHATFGDESDLGEPLNANGILAMVDPAASDFGIANIPLDLTLLATLELVMERLVRTALRMERRDGTGVDMLATAEARAEALSEFLMEDFGDALANGTGTLWEGATRLRRLEVLGADGAPLASWRPEAMALPAVALLARTDDAAGAWTFAQRLCNVFAKAMIADDAELPLGEVDLGLGVPTRSFGATWPLGGGRQLRIEGELQPHWFVCQGTLVLSTSVALSKTLIARAAATGKPAPGNTFAWSRVTGSRLRPQLQMLAQATDALGSEAAREFRAALDMQPAKSLLGPLAAEFSMWCAALAELETRDRIVDGEYQSHTRLRWQTKLQLGDAGAPRPGKPESAPIGVQVFTEAPADRERYVALPDGTYVEALNGARGAPAMCWPEGRPWSPIIGTERDVRGQLWYVHADGAKSTTLMTYRADLGRPDPITQVAIPTGK